MVVLIVAISCATSVATSYLKAKKRADPKLLKRIEALEARVGDGSLEERVRTLETIVTDEKRRLDSEIRNL